MADGRADLGGGPAGAEGTIREGESGRGFSSGGVTWLLGQASIEQTHQGLTLHACDVFCFIGQLRFVVFVALLYLPRISQMHLRLLFMVMGAVSAIVISVIFSFDDDCISVTF
jgi:hypothetical protein